MSTEKFTRSSIIIDRILKIIQGFLIAGIIVSAIFIPLTAVFGEKVIADASSLTLGNLTVKLTGDFQSYLDMEGIKTSIIVILVSGIAACAAGWFCLKKLREILVPMREGRPFEAGTSNRIRQLAFTVLIGGGIAEVFKAVGTGFELKAYNLEKLIDHPSIEHITINYRISLWFVGAALFLLFLSYIFRYGEELQKESDETL